jgi:phosphoribosylformylglycinamidine synthase
MVELNLVTGETINGPKMLHNESGKFESGFIAVSVPENNSVMFDSLSGMQLGAWVAHGEGKFSLPSKDGYEVVGKYAHSSYPANPNGSDGDVAAICSTDGRHLAMMPHLERAFFPWQCGYYPASRKNDEVTPWVEAFVNARRWVEKQ